MLQFLILLSRNTQTDDGRGLNEPLNVTSPLDDTQWLFWSPDSPDSDDLRTRIIQQINQPVVIGFAAPVATVADYAKNHVLQSSFLLAALPPSLHLQAAILLGEGNKGADRVLLRFMNSHASEALTFSLWHIIPEHIAALVLETRCCACAEGSLLLLHPSYIMVVFIAQSTSHLHPQPDWHLRRSPHLSS
jgi:hypothetical protein